MIQYGPYLTFLSCHKVNTPKYFRFRNHHINWSKMKTWRWGGGDFRVQRDNQTNFRRKRNMNWNIARQILRKAIYLWDVTIYNNNKISIGFIVFMIIHDLKEITSNGATASERWSLQLVAKCLPFQYHYSCLFMFIVYHFE